MCSHRLFCRSLRLAALPLLLLLFQFTSALSQTIHYKPVDRSLVETRLKNYGGNDKQLAATLKKVFIHGRFEEPHLCEQIVKGTRPPNVMCGRPGSSGHRKIV